MCGDVRYSSSAEKSKARALLTRTYTDRDDETTRDNLVCGSRFGMDMDGCTEYGYGTVRSTVWIKYRIAKIDVR